MIRTFWPASLILVLSSLVIGILRADEISINFNNTTDPNWVLPAAAQVGPLNSANWNNTSSASGTLGTLVDNIGVATSASINWSSSNTWTNGDGNTSPERILLHPYLDDGGAGVSITVSNIPYAQYLVYGLLSSDQTGDNTAYTTLDFSVNGNPVLGGSAIAGSDWDYALNNFGPNPWRQITASQVGNYWLSSVQTSSTLTISGSPRNGSQRGSIAGLIVQQIPEPGSLLVLAGSMLSLALVRRRQA